MDLSCDRLRKYSPWSLRIASIAIVIPIAVNFGELNFLARTNRFTQPIQLGFTAGDDWEPAIAADRFGHLYTVYHHGDAIGDGNGYISKLCMGGMMV